MRQRQISDRQKGNNLTNYTAERKKKTISKFSLYNLYALCFGQIALGPKPFTDSTSKSSESYSYTDVLFAHAFVVDCGGAGEC